MYVAQTKRSINRQINLAQQSRLQLLRPYCPNKYIVCCCQTSKYCCQNRILSFIRTFILWFVLHFYGVFITKHLLPFQFFFRIYYQTKPFFESNLDFYGVLLSHYLFFGFIMIPSHFLIILFPIFSQLVRIVIVKKFHCHLLLLTI